MQTDSPIKQYRSDNWLAVTKHESEWGRFDYGGVDFVIYWVIFVF